MTTATRVTHEPRNDSPRAAIYLRVSSAQQEVGFSLDTQEQHCREFAEAHGADSLDIYREVYTGTELWERPQLTALREAIRHHDIDMVIAYSIDRLSRDPIHLGVVLSEAEHAGVPVLFVTEPLDDSPEGQLIRFVRGYAAKVEHEKMRERVLRGRRARAESGKPIVSQRPLYGYRWNADKSALLEEPDAAAVVRRIFRDVAGGATLRQLAATLTAEGISTPTGATAWNRTTLSDIMLHPFYKGEAAAYRYRAGKSKNGSRVSYPCDASGQIPLPAGTVPALVDIELWRAVQDVKARNQREASRRNRHPEDFLLRGGYVVCAGCGQPMHADTGHARGKEWRRYVCFRKYLPVPQCEHTLSIDAPTLDEGVWAELSELIQRPETIRDALARLHREDVTAADMTAVNREIAKVERRIASLTKSIAGLADEEGAGVEVAREALMAELRLQGARSRMLAEERAGVEQRRQQWQAQQARLDDLEHWIGQVREKLPTIDYAHKRDALEWLAVRVEVYPKAWTRSKPWQTSILPPPLLSDPSC
jgi:site-specific DNA recombinase